MSNEIDKKILAFIENNYPHAFEAFQIHFNLSVLDAVNVFRKAHAIYGRYMTQDYCTTMLGLARYRVEKALNKNR